jgi:hypothetical protein
MTKYTSHLTVPLGVAQESSRGCEKYLRIKADFFFFSKFSEIFYYNEGKQSTMIALIVVT